MSNLLPVEELTELDLTEAEDATVCTIYHRLDDLGYCPWAHLSLGETETDKPHHPFTVNLQFSHIWGNTLRQAYWKQWIHNKQGKMVFGIGYTKSHLTALGLLGCIFACIAMCGLSLQSVSASIFRRRAAAVAEGASFYILYTTQQT